MPSTKPIRTFLAFLCLVIFATHGTAQDDLWKRFYEAGEEAMAQGQYASAEEFFKLALKQAEGFRPDDVRLAKTFHALAQVSGTCLTNAELAEELKHDMRERGENEQRVAEVIADLYPGLGKCFAGGRWEDVELLLRKALRVNEKALGEDNPEAANILDQLAEFLVWHRADGGLEAEQLYLRALRIREKAFGPDRFQVARSMETLAEFYERDGKLQEAEDSWRRAIAARERSGCDPRETLVDCPNDVLLEKYVSLARVLKKEEKWAEAVSSYKQALAVAEDAHLPNDQELQYYYPFYEHTAYELADLYRELGDLDEAEALYDRALELLEQSGGSYRFQLGKADLRDNAADFFAERGKVSRAEELYRLSLADRERICGPEARVVGLNLTKLASILEKTGRQAEANDLRTRAQQLGPSEDLAYGVSCE